MVETLTNIRNLFRNTLIKTFPHHETNGNEGPQPSTPQIGFKVSLCADRKQMKVKVIGARQLPTAYGSAKPCGYLVKVRIFPEKEKFETTTAAQSWPMFNEEFVFPLLASKVINRNFVSFTVYAVLEQDSTGNKTLNQNGGKYDNGGVNVNLFQRLLNLNELRSSNSFRRSHRRSSFRCSLANRRIIGTTTYTIDERAFSLRLGDWQCTPDVWRDIREISTNEPRDGKKGSVEITLCYDQSEDGCNDVVEVSVTRLRCNLQTMQEHEKLRGHLYIKITAFENDDIAQKMKSDRFDPTISLKLEPKTSSLRATVNKCNIKQVKIFIRLFCRQLLLAKKILLGQIEINSSSSIWREIVSKPSVPITRVIHFE